MVNPQDAANDGGRDLECARRESRTGLLPLFLLVGFLLFVFTNRDGDVARNQYEDIIRDFDHQLSNYSAWLNGTATDFTLPDRDVHVEQLVSQIIPLPHQLDASFDSYYSSASGTFRGDARYYDLSSIPHDAPATWRPIADRVMEDANLSAIPELLGPWNWSAADTIGIEMDDRATVGYDVPERSAISEGKLKLSGPDALGTMVLDFFGVHFMKNGSFYAFAREEGSIDARYLPGVVPAGARNATALIIQGELARRISELKSTTDWETKFEKLSASGDKLQRHGCHFTFYGQLAPTRVPEKLMLELEQEILDPSGIPTVEPPKMILKGVLISERCGIMYHVGECAGMSTREYHRDVITYTGWSSLIYLVMLVLLNRQQTAWIDMVTVIILMSQATNPTANASIPFITLAALAVILFSCEVRLFYLICEVQGSEDTTSRHAAATAAPIRDTLVMVFMKHLIETLQNDPRVKICLVLAIFLGIDQYATSMFLLAVVIAHSMLWLPQIVRSALRERRGGLTIEYLVGTTICRLLLAFYYLGYSGNIFAITPRPWVWTFGGWIAFLVFVVLLQDRFGPTFFLPAQFTTAKTHDYHPPMQLSDLESPDRSLGVCAICLDAVTVDSSTDRAFDAVRRNMAGRANLRKRYSLTPCHHLFHTACLETWLAFKNICPQCRRPLPPL